MKSSSSRALVSALVALLLFAPSSLAIEAVWTGGPTGSWSDPANWSTGVVPNTIATNVAIDDGSLQDSAVVLDQDATIQNLVVDAGDSLHLDPSRKLTTSSVTIGGEVFLDAASQLEVSDYILIEPTSILALADGAKIVRASNTEFLPIWNQGRIEGAGTFHNNVLPYSDFRYAWNNEGTVVANVPDGSLQIHLYGTNSRGVHFNRGELIAENGGELRVSGQGTTGAFFTPLDNGMGIVEARGDSSVFLRTIRLVGGRVSTSSEGGATEGTVSLTSTMLENVTLEGNIKLQSVTFSSRVVNNTHPSSVGGHYIDGHAMISGNGTLDLNYGGIERSNPLSGGSYGGTPSFVNDVNHTIKGPGIINSSRTSNGLAFENRGLMETEEGTLRISLRTQVLTSAASSINVGVIRAKTGGRVEMLGSSWNDLVINRDAATMGLVEADVDSTVKLDNLRLQGGVLRTIVPEEGSTSQPGTVVGTAAVLEDVRLEGKIGDDNSTWLLTGNIKNTDQFTGSSIRVLGPTTLTGGGEIRLAVGMGIGGYSTANSTIESLINEDNLIAGTGSVGEGITFKNRGVIRADIPDSLLAIRQSSYSDELPVFNSGSMEAINGGKLHIESLLVNYEGSDLGTIHAGDGSEVRVSVVKGGILSSEGTGKIVVTWGHSEFDPQLEEVRNRGTLVFETGTRLVGRIVNNGTVTQNSFSSVHLTGPFGELTGTGVWGTPESRLAIAVGSFTPGLIEHGAQHTIQGGGKIYVGFSSFVNNGTVIANSVVPLVITTDEGGTFQQQGSLFVADSRTMEMQIYDARFVNQGVIDAAGTFQLSRMNEGAVEFRNAPEAELHVNSIFAVSSPASEGYSVHLWNQEGALLSGHGNVNLYDAAVDQETLLLNSGILRPEGDTSPFGEIMVSGNFQQDSTGLLELELGGTSASGEFDLLQISDGLAMLGGTLDLFLVGGYDPNVGDSFDILTNLDGEVQGSFDTFAPPPLAGRWWNLEYLGNRVVLSVEAITADLDGNGIVDDLDLGLWQTGYGVDASGDADGDGDTDGLDLLAWQRQRGSGVELGAGVAVPEPTALVLCLLSTAVLTTLRTCSRILVGCHCWLVQQCDAGTRRPLLDRTSSGTRYSTIISCVGRPLASLLAAFTLLVSVSRADEAIWIGGPTGNWSDPENWSTGIVPNDPTTNTTIDDDPLATSLVNLDQFVNVGNVFVGANDVLSLDPGSVGLFNSVTIEGEAQLADSSRLQVSAAFLVQPAATLLLAEHAHAIQSSRGLLRNRGRIEGAGAFTFESASWSNQGIVTANVPGKQLQINNLSNQSFNQGELIAENGGTLSISRQNRGSTPLDNSSGLLEARGDSTLTLSKLRIIGGRVSTSTAGGANEGTVTLSNETFLENVTVEGNILLDIAGLSGRTTNNSRLQAVGAKNVLVEGYATLSGNGSLELNGGKLYAPFSNSSQTHGLLNDLNHTITGPGVINSEPSGNLLMIDNRGVIESAEDTLQLFLGKNISFSTSIEPSTNSGTIRARSGGRLEILSLSSFYEINNFSGSTSGIIEAGVDSTVMLGYVRLRGGVLRAVAPKEGNPAQPGKIVTNYPNPAMLEGVRIEGAIGDTTLPNLWFLAGTIENTGTLTGTISIAEPTTLTGGGQVILTGTGDLGPGPVDSLLNQDNLIRGRGHLGRTSAFSNRGTVQADIPNQTLTVFDNYSLGHSEPVFNSGEMKAINGGKLVIEASLVNYEGSNLGTIHAGDGSEVEISHVDGGNLSTDGTGKIVVAGSGYVSNVHNQGLLNVDYRPEFHGRITNDGTILNRSPTAPAYFDGAFAELTGTGNWGAANAPVAIQIGPSFQSSASTIFTHGSKHTIQGRGTINVTGGTFINRGTVIASGSAPLVIELKQGATMRQQGTLVVDSPGTMEVRVFDELFQNRGTIDAAGTFRFSRANYGPVEFQNVSGAELHVSSLFDLSYPSGNGVTVSLWNQGDALISGHGNVSLFRASYNFETLFRNSGTLRPEGADNPFGEISISGNFLQDTTGLLELELGGTANGQFDAVHVTNGFATLGGTLDVSLAGGYDPAIGDSFDILTNLEGEVRDRFQSFIAPALAGRWWSLDYLADRVTLSVNAITADFDGNGIVDYQDLDDWQAAYGVEASGDADGDGDTDGQDWLTWQRQLGSGVEVGTAQAVPEPASLWLVLMALGSSLLAARDAAKR